MVGSFKLIVKNEKNEYKFDLNRNITILRGNSGTGKTTLFTMIRDYNVNGKRSGVHLQCKVDVIAYSKTKDWENDLKKINNSIIVIDENDDFIETKEFAEIVKKSNNYFLLITRNYLKQLPYSVNEIYVVRGAKNKIFENEYKNNLNYYSEIFNKYDILIIEDSGSGFDFYNRTVKDDIECIASGGRDNITKLANKYKNKNILIIADGAAFGPEIKKIFSLSEENGFNITIFLPESFEWLILKSGLISKNIKELIIPSNYIESSKYESWEQFFTDLLITLTKNDKIKKYGKKKLPKFYLIDKNVDKIYKNIKLVDIRK